MSPPFLVWNLRAEMLAGAVCVGVLGAYVALRLMRGLATVGLGARWRRMLSASLALGIGGWSAHVLVISGESVPGFSGHDASLLGAAFAATLVGTLAAQFLLVGGVRSSARLIASSIALGTGLSAGPWLALMALGREPGIAWRGPGLAGAWILACAGAGAALLLVPVSPRVQGRGGRKRLVLAAILLGATLVGTDLAVIFSARVPVAAGAGAVAPGGGDWLNLLTMFAGPALLALLLLVATLEDRFRDLISNARDELQRATYTDPLTSLPNRLLFEERLKRAVHRADRGQRRLALLFVNVDGLKGVNELFGQNAGDALLRALGQRLQALSEGELVARVGGDEFLLLLENNPTVADVSQRAAQLLEAIARPCSIDRREVVVSASIGIAIYPEHGSHARLVPHAAAALHAAKDMGGATYCFFEASMVTGKREEIELLRDLRSALENHEFELYYQPKIHAPSGQITGAEALLRWHHPRRGMISPLVFIPMAEQYGLINAMGNWVIEDACRQIRVWRNQGLRMRVAINLSMHQLRQPDLAARIVAALKRNRLEPRVLTCEITESIAMDDNQGTLSVINQLAALNVHLSIDDFGTGYSNLSCLRKLPATEIKIDRGFVLDLETSGDARAIVDAVVKLAQALGLKVVAEGVETERQQHLLSQFGCEELQGFLFARPMSAQALAHWAMNHEGPRSLAFRPSLFGETKTLEVN
jgi:diguanylate cyclase (GGDEF)-like protein